MRTRRISCTTIGQVEKEVIMRKFLSVTLTLILLFTMAVPALATTNDTEPTDTRTVEEILNEYHEKSFAAEMEEKSGNPSVYSRQANSGKSLEEETVEELRAAGYEAYHVTSSNYDALEDSLKTDFGEMGLDPNGSYIITISGEPSGDARSVDPPSEDYYDGGGSGSYFLYTYGNTTYKMRYLTISPSTAGGTSQTKHKDMLGGFDFGAFLARLVDTYIAYRLDRLTGKFYLGTVLSICGVSVADIADEETAQLDYYATVNWTRSCTQIYVEGMEAWETRNIVDYASMHRTWTGHYFSNSLLRIKTIDQYDSNSHYSPHYFDYDWRKEQAVLAYNNYTVYDEYVGNMEVYSTLEQYFPESTTAPMWTFYCPYD